MTGLLLFLLLSLLAAAGLWLLVRGRAQRILDWERLPEAIEPVDMAALRNLTDPAEDEWLRAQLPRLEYLQVRRERMAAAADYAGRTHRNAVLLVRFGQAAAQSEDPALAAAGHELVVTAMRTRWQTLRTLTQLRAASLLPVARVSVAVMSDDYQRLRDRVDRVGRLRSPLLAARLGAAM